MNLVRDEYEENKYFSNIGNRVYDYFITDNDEFEFGSYSYNVFMDIFDIYVTNHKLQRKEKNKNR